VIEMANDQVPVSEIRQPMQQRHRVAAPRHANEITAGARKMGGYMWIEDQFLFRRRLHIVQQATSAESRQEIKEPLNAHFTEKAASH
jgi:hypothetical protein